MDPQMPSTQQVDAAWAAKRKAKKEKRRNKPKEPFKLNITIKPLSCEGKLLIHLVLLINLLVTSYAQAEEVRNKHADNQK